jgi:hypothetical protein
MTAGPPLGLPDVKTSGRPASARSRWWSAEYGSMTPVRLEGPLTSGVIAVGARDGARTMGRAGDASAAWSSSPSSATSSAAGTSGTMIAKGFSSRRLRRRSSATAEALVASQTRWKAPSPCTPRIFPSLSRDAAASRAPRACSGAPVGLASHTLGPHAGHAIVCAWKRRSEGSA